MKKISVIGLLILSFAMSCFGQEPCKRQVESKSGFSYCPPEGWAFNKQLDAVLGPPAEAFTPNLTWTEMDAPGSLNEIASMIVRKYSEHAQTLGAAYIKLESKSDFATVSGEPGLKLVFRSQTKGLDLRTVQFLFSGKGDQKLLLNFMALEKDAIALDSTFDRSMKTLRLEP